MRITATFLVLSNRKSGKGRLDVIIIPKNRSKTCLKRV